MTSRSTRETRMLEVLQDVARAGLEPLLWHLDRAGLQAFRNAAAGTPDPMQSFMNVPIDPVAKFGADWTLDVAFGISIRGQWPEPSKGPSIVRRRRKRRPVLTLH